MKTKKIAILAVIAAVYAGLTVALSFMSYGPIQFRIAEALCVLPFFFPQSAAALTVGCVLSNLISGMGIYDIVFGSLATLSAALCTVCVGQGYRRKRAENKAKLKVSHMIMAPMFAVVLNAVIVGLMISFVFMGISLPIDNADFVAILYNMCTVGFGQLVCCYAFGVPLMVLIDKRKDLYKSFI